MNPVTECGADLRKKDYCVPAVSLSMSDSASFQADSSSPYSDSLLSSSGSLAVSAVADLTKFMSAWMLSFSSRCDMFWIFSMSTGVLVSRRLSGFRSFFVGVLCDSMAAEYLAHSSRPFLAFAEDIGLFVCCTSARTSAGFFFLVTSTMLAAIDVIEGDGLTGWSLCGFCGGLSCPEVGTSVVSGFLVCCPQIGAVCVLVGVGGLRFVSGRFPQTGVLLGLAGGFGVSAFCTILASPDL